MKRTRSATAAANASQNRIHTCSYRGCHKQFKSEKSLQAHLPTHQASYPLICPHKPCKSRFAVQSEQDRHVRNVHIPPRRSLRNLRNKDEQPRGAEVLLPSDEGSETPLEASKHAHERQSVSDNKTEEEDEAELEEIIDNAVYLASQIKVARSYKIGSWEAEDFRRLYLWAHWVQENVKEFQDGPRLERAVKEKGLCMSALRNAERAFFDSVLGFEGFDAKILSYLFSAVVPVPQQSAETVVDGDKLEGLMSAISAAVDRKKQLATLSNIVERLNSFASSNKGARDVKCDVVAKAEALLKKHLRLSEKTMQEHLKTIDAKDDASFELVCHEALLACDGDAKGCERVKGILLSFIRTVVEKNSNVIMRTDDTLMGELCDRDVCVFDAYLSMLLSAHVKMNAAKAGGRTKIKDVDLEEVRMRIRSLMGRKGPVGHSSRSVVEAYCAKTGTQEFRCKQ